MPDDAVPLTVVVAAVIRDREGRILLARRPRGRHMEGLWEFPGGKVVGGESPRDALVRELREELGITTRVDAPVIFAEHEEPGLRILLLFYTTAIVAGTPVPKEGQELRWVEPALLPTYATPPADAELISQLAHAVQ
jgi:8-oxo-dGTP diphosphatase